MQLYRNEHHRKKIALLLNEQTGKRSSIERLLGIARFADYNEERGNENKGDQRQ